MISLLKALKYSGVVLTALDAAFSAVKRYQTSRLRQKRAKTFEDAWRSLPQQFEGLTDEEMAEIKSLRWEHEPLREEDARLFVLLKRRRKERLDAARKETGTPGSSGDRDHS